MIKWGKLKRENRTKWSARSLSAHCLGCNVVSLWWVQLAWDLMLWSPNPISLSLSLSFSLSLSLLLTQQHFPLTCALGFFHICQIGISCLVVVGGGEWPQCGWWWGPTSSPSPPLPFIHYYHSPVLCFFPTTNLLSFHQTLFTISHTTFPYFHSLHPLVSNSFQTSFFHTWPDPLG